MRIDLHNAVRGALALKETLQERREGEVALTQPCLGCGCVQWPRTKPATASLVSVGDIHCFHDCTSAKACRVLWPFEGERAGDYITPGQPLFRLFERCSKTQQSASERSRSIWPLAHHRAGYDIRLSDYCGCSYRGTVSGHQRPTPAVIAVDQLHRFLRVMAKRELHDYSLCDSDGGLRLLLRTPKLERLCGISLREIRFYGASSFQNHGGCVLQGLVAELPEGRRPTGAGDFDRA